MKLKRIIVILRCKKMFLLPKIYKNVQFNSLLPGIPKMFICVRVKQIAFWKKLSVWISVLSAVSQFAIFKPLSFCFEETIGFEERTSFASRRVSLLIWWYTKPGYITKELWEKVIQFHGSFHGLKITNCSALEMGKRET